MKCENCGKNEVNFVFQSNINGQVEEKRLCHECAEKLGYTRRLQQSYAGMQNLFRKSFTGFLSPMRMLAGVSADPFDGFFGGSLLGDGFFNDFFTTPALGGQVQDAAPAQEQGEPLVSDQERRHISRERELNALRQELNQAIMAENFERAAELRDQIHAKEKAD